MEILSCSSPHIFMWFCDGIKVDQKRQSIFSDDQLMLPKNDQLDYLEMLKQECAKLQKTNSPCYLVYLGRTLTEGQKAQFTNLEELPGMENLVTINYDEFEQKISDIVGSYSKVDYSTGKVVFAREEIEISASDIKEETQILVNNINNKNCLQTLIDLSRLVLIYHSDIVLEMALSHSLGNEYKTDILTKCGAGILYRDFDVALRGQQMQDLPTVQGYICSLGFEDYGEEYTSKMQALLKAINDGGALEEMPQLENSVIGVTHPHNDRVASIICDVFSNPLRKILPEGERLNYPYSGIRRYFRSSEEEVFTKPNNLIFRASAQDVENNAPVILAFDTTIRHVTWQKKIEENIIPSASPHMPFAIDLDRTKDKFLG